MYGEILVSPGGEHLLKKERQTVFPSVAQKGGGKPQDYDRDQAPAFQKKHEGRGCVQRVNRSDYKRKDAVFL